jgi:hypothetical protein
VTIDAIRGRSISGSAASLKGVDDRPDNFTMTSPTSPDHAGPMAALRRVSRLSAVVVSTVALVASLAGGAAAMVGTTSATGARSHATPRLEATGHTSPGRANPSKSMKPSAAFMRYCFEAGHTSQCNQAALADIDAARHSEHVKNLYLPKGFYSYNNRRQLRVIADHERFARGLPNLATSSRLNADAQAGAESGQDPQGPSNYSWGSNIAWGYVTPLAADFGWMYDDGTKSPNVACHSAGESGCWGHRDNILSPWGGTQGSGDYDNKGTQQLTQLFVKS